MHYITLHYITFHYITLHYITLHYIPLHNIALHYIHTWLTLAKPISPPFHPLVARAALLLAHRAESPESPSSSSALTDRARQLCADLRPARGGGQGGALPGPSDGDVGNDNNNGYVWDIFHLWGMIHYMCIFGYPIYGINIPYISRNDNNNGYVWDIFSFMGYDSLYAYFWLSHLWDKYPIHIPYISCNDNNNGYVWDIYGSYIPPITNG